MILHPKLLNSHTIGILDGCLTNGIAARLANNYNGGNKGDWYLPSINELSLMYWSIVHDPDIDPDTQPSFLVWSSTEGSYSEQFSQSLAWCLSFNDGHFFAGVGKQNNSPSVRPIRSF